MTRKEDNYWDERGDPSADLDRMRKRAGQHSGRPRGPTVGDALVDAVAGKIAGSIAEALFDDDENGVVGPVTAALWTDGAWQQRIKDADKSYEDFKAQKEVEERREEKLAGQKWDADWKGLPLAHANPAPLPNYSYLPPSNPTAAPSFQQRHGAVSDWIAPAAASAAVAPSYATTALHSSDTRDAARRAKYETESWGEEKPRVDRARKNRARKKCARKNHARKKVQGVSAKNIKISKISKYKNIKISKIKLFMICFIFIFINYLK